jgi:16S rRNA processing protein RimM
MKRRSSSLSDQQTNQTGSPMVGGPVFLAVGKLRRPHGVEGEISMEIITDFPDRLSVGKTLYVGESHEALKLRSARSADQALLVSFDDIDNPEKVGHYRNQYVYITAESAPPLPEGMYYHHQLMNMAVVDPDGQMLGTLTDILETGANEVYVVATPEGSELLLPVIEGVVLEINPEKREIVAKPPAWL